MEEGGRLVADLKPTPKSAASHVDATGKLTAFTQ